MDIQKPPLSAPPAGATAPDADQPRDLRDIRKRPWLPLSPGTALVLLALLLSPVLLWLLTRTSATPQDNAGEAARQARLAAVEEMEGRLEGNVGRRSKSGPSLDFKYWADQERKRETTVRQTLLSIGARLRGDKVVDREGKILYFWWATEFTGAWDDEMRRKEEERIRMLEAKYRLIRMYLGSRSL